MRGFDEAICIEPTTSLIRDVCAVIWFIFPFITGNEPLIAAALLTHFISRLHARKVQNNHAPTDRVRWIGAIAVTLNAAHACYAMKNGRETHVMTHTGRCTKAGETTTGFVPAMNGPNVAHAARAIALVNLTARCSCHYTSAQREKWCDFNLRRNKLDAVKQFAETREVCRKCVFICNSQRGERVMDL